jgi:cobalt-zinc-cadmium efflux system membrane fusion protein
VKTQTLISTVLFACLLAAACNKPEAASGSPATKESRNKDELVLTPEQQATGAIATQAAVISREPELLRVKGTIALADDQTWRVGVRTDGLVANVFAGLGDLVHKGQVLARYHADEAREAHAQYRAALSELDRAQSAAGQSQRNLARAQKLLDLKAGSVQQVETAQQDLVNGQAAIRKAQTELDRVRDLLEDDLHVPANPQGAGAEATADEVPIFAPGDGYIIEKNVTSGTAVQPSNAAFIIGNLSRVWMLASVRQEDLGKIHTGQPATVTLPGQEELRFPGKITNPGQAFDPAMRVMQVRIDVENEKGRLRPEMLANAEIPTGGGKPVLVVPSDAVQQINGQDAVFVKTAPNKFVVRAIHTGETREGKTPILEGLNAGDMVVVHGSFMLKSQLLRSSLEE